MKEREEPLENNSINRIDWEELYMQEREEILNTPHSLMLECVVPPLEEQDGPGDYMLVAPLLRSSSNEGYSSMTMALLIKTLERYIGRQLAEENIKEAYDILTDAIVNNKEEDENDTD